MRSGAYEPLSPCAPNAPNATPTNPRIAPATAKFTRALCRFDLDLASLDALGLRKLDLEHAVHDARLDAVDVDVGRHAKASHVIADVVLGVEGLQVRVVVDRDAPLDGQLAVIQGDRDRLLVDAGHVR